MIFTIALGCLIGILMGITGAGGGILAIPALVYGLHLTMTQAAPIALIAIAVAAGIGAGIGFRNGIVRYRAAILMALAGMVASPIGTILSGYIKHATLVLIFVGVLMYIIYATTMNQQADVCDANAAMPCKLNPESGRFIWNSRCALSVLFAGAVAGFLSGMIGVGGGFIIMPALSAVSSLSKESTVATALAVIAIVSMSAAVSHAFIGEVLWQSTALFTFGAMLGMGIGSLVLPYVSPRFVKRMYTGLIVGVIVLMLDSIR